MTWRGGWGTAGRDKREGYAYIELIHIVAQQKLTLHCKLITPQFKKFNYKNKQTKIHEMSLSVENFTAIFHSPCSCNSISSPLQKCIPK